MAKVITSFMTPALAVCILLVTTLFSSACNSTDSQPPVQKPQEKQFLVGLIPEQNLFRQIERYEPLAKYLAGRTGLHIKLTVLPRYGNIIDNFMRERMDAAFFGSFTYALAHSKLGVHVLARPENPDGSSTYHGLIFVRKDSGISSARHMRGKRFAFVDRATTAGYLLPLAYFKKSGFDYKTSLRETYYSGTHEDTIYDVLQGRADIGAAKNTVYDRVATSDSRIKGQMKILENSPDVPENAFAVRKDLDESLKKKLAEALLNMHACEEGRAVLAAFGARRFIPTSDSDYQPVYRYARETGLDLESYDYINE